MCDKHNKTIIKTSEWDEVYIIKYIAKSFSEFVLIFVMHTSHSEIVFSVTVLNVSSYIQICEHNLITDFLNINIASLNRKIKTYRLWYW